MKKIIKELRWRKLTNVEEEFVICLFTWTWIGILLCKVFGGNGLFIFFLSFGILVYTKIPYYKRFKVNVKEVKK